MKIPIPDIEPQVGIVTILIVEDSRTQAERLKHILERNNYRVLVASNGKEALVIVSANRPKIVITDVMMPEMDGYDLCRQIKSEDSYKDIPVILLTSLTDTKDVLKGLECGADSFIVKPFEEKYLLSRIQYFLANEGLRKIQNTKIGLELYFESQKYLITSDRIQILDLLLSTYESAVQRNLELIGTQEELRKLNEQLETKVSERTAALTAEITERKHMEEQLRQAQKMEAIGQLAGGVAHDFNNILMAITAYYEVMMMKLVPDDPLRNDLIEIQKATEQGVSLTRQLLAFSRKQVLEPKVLDLNQVVANTRNMLRRLVGVDVELHTIFQKELGHVKADPGQVEQIIVNLAVNARDAMPEGGQLIIETSNVRLDENSTRQYVDMNPGDYVLLSVADTGYGMEEETRSHIFEPFFTTKVEGKGTGLGLSTVYGIVQQTGGHITVYSELGKGTIFKIYLPRIDQPVEAKISASPGIESSGHETILLVDDNDAVRIAVATNLQMRGYTVLEASHGAEAWEIFQKHDDEVHLLITDMVMPQMSGPELSKRIRAEHPELKVLYMSGYSEAAIQCNAVLEAGSAFLQKPYSTKTLLQKVRELLDKNSQ